MFSSTDIPILISGESGTGKEVIADYIYALNMKGKKQTSAYVKINCAAIPNELLEAELFGYEKGSFTGAISSRPGRSRKLTAVFSFLMKSVTCHWFSK